MWEIAVYLVVAGGVFLCCPFSHEMSWMRSWTSLSQFLRVFLPSLGSSKPIVVVVVLVFCVHGKNLRSCLDGQLT